MPTTLDADRLKHEWTGMRAKVKERWDKLGDDDLIIHGGNVDQFLNRLHKVTGEDRTTIESYLSELMYGSANPAARRLVESKERLQAKASEAARLVRRKPVESFTAVLGAGFVVGLAIGLVVRRD